MFLQQRALLITNIRHVNTQHFSGINHIRKAVKDVATIRMPTQMPIRLNYRRAEQAFEQKLATHLKEPRRPGLLVKPLLFMIGASGVSMVGAAVWEYEYVRSQIKKMMASTSTGFPFTKERQDSDMGSFVEYLRKGDLMEAWSQLSSSDKFVFPILLTNVLIFVLWRIPSMRPRLMRSFTANPFGQAPCRSMFLSIFSHYSFFQMFANMLALYSLSDGICYALGQEQAMFLFVTAGLFSNYASYTRKILGGINAPSRGAPVLEFFTIFQSGAILGLLGYSWSKHPDIALEIPGSDFMLSAGDALYGILVFNLLGIAFKSRNVDHVAHLSGAMFGILWHYFGEDRIWLHRGLIVEKIHAFRKSNADK